MRTEEAQAWGAVLPVAQLVERIGQGHGQDTRGAASARVRQRWHLRVLRGGRHQTRAWALVPRALARLKPAPRQLAYYIKLI